MNSFCSIKQVEKCRAEVGEELAPLPIFAGGVVVSGGDGITADPQAGRLLLPGGSAFFVAFSVQALWKTAESVTLAVIVGNDPRFRGPRAVAEHERGAKELHLPVRKLVATGSEFVSRVPAVEWDERVTRSLTAFGIIAVPPGPPQEVALWASAEGESERGHDAPKITFSGGELIAIAITSAKGSAA